MEKLNLKEYISLEGASLDKKMQEERQKWENVLRGYQEQSNQTPEVLREMDAIQTIINDPEILKAYTTNSVQTFIDERITIIKDSSLAGNLDKKPASELVTKLTSSYDCSGMDFSSCITEDDVRKVLYEEAGIDYISPQEVKKAYNNVNQLVESNSNVTEAMQTYEDLCHKAHCFVDNTGHLVLGENWMNPSDKVPYYQSGKGMATLTNANQSELSRMMGENVAAKESTSGKTM